MLVITLPFSIDALRWGAGRYLPGTHVDIEKIAGEPTLPLAAGSAGSFDQALAGRESRVRVFGSEWLVIEALPADMLLPRSSWTASRYLAALTALADLHATWWGQPPDLRDCPWAWTPLGQHGLEMAKQARAALLEIGAAPWGSKFFAPGHIRAWLRALDDPAALLGILDQMPQTLIHGGHPQVHTNASTGATGQFDWQIVGVGPAPYDLACFYSASRWCLGRVPLTLTAMRDHYLQHLNDRLDRPIDRYLFDAAFDASRAWSFLTLWPAAILDRHASLLATRHHLQSTVLEPAYASLRRCSA
jgi:hypothetical protein